MRPRLTVTQLRVLILVVNGILALGVPAFAAYHYFGSLAEKGPGKDRAQRPTTVHPRGTFAYVDQGGAPTQNDRSGVPGVVGWLQPRAPEAIQETPTKVDPTTEPAATPVADAKDYQPGPLATEPHNLEYVWYIVREDPTDTQVVLAKKAAATPGMPMPGVPGSSKASPRIRPTTPAARKRTPAKGVAQPSDAVQFYVHERHFKDDERGLDFWIHEANTKHFVYWMPEDEGKPKKTYYALKYTPPGEYLSREADEPPLIGPPPLSDEAKAQAEAEKGKAKIHVRPRKDYTSKREEEYHQIVEGKITPAKAATFGSEIQSGTPPAPDTAPAIAPGATSKPPVRGSNLPSGPRRPTAQETKKLLDGTKDLPKDVQNKVIDAMRGAK